MIADERIVWRNKAKTGIGPVVYWMRRDFRVRHNWSLAHAVALSKLLGVEVRVVVLIRPNLEEVMGTERMRAFWFAGLKELEQDLCSKGIRFQAIATEPGEYWSRQGQLVSAVVTDCLPTLVGKLWDKTIGIALPVRYVVVDSHNVIPVTKASNKREFAAYTLRPKIKRLFDQFFCREVEVARVSDMVKPTVDWGVLETAVKVNTQVKAVTKESGEKAAEKQLMKFVGEKLGNYEAEKNDPTLDATSGLSAYLHFGQISSAQVLHEVLDQPWSKARDSFVEEILVRKELADNFCWFGGDYTKVSVFPAWALKTLGEHAGDKREWLYALEELEAARTHDSAWNAAQNQMRETGWMHGYMRMYWAKKILEWTESAQEALDIAIYLNDLYQLDGRDPNGYAGIAWSLGGVHDRPWFERPVFGKIRYMAESGLKRKFDLKAYVAKWT